MSAKQIGNVTAEGIDLIAAFEKSHPGITAAIDARVNKAVANLTPVQRTEVATIGGVAIVVVTGILVATGHPLEAAEVGTIVGGLTFIGHGIQNKLFAVKKAILKGGE